MTRRQMTRGVNPRRAYRRRPRPRSTAMARRSAAAGPRGHTRPVATPARCQPRRGSARVPFPISFTSSKFRRVLRSRRCSAANSTADPPIYVRARPPRSHKSREASGRAQRRPRSPCHKSPSVVRALRASVVSAREGASDIATTLRTGGIAFRARGSPLFERERRWLS